MKRSKAIWTASLAALACTGSAQAHHTGSMYDTTAVWLTGTVVSFENINPHTITTVEARGADGRIRRWGIEGPSRSQLDRMDGIGVPQVGDTLEVCAFTYRPVAELSRMFPGVDFSSRRAAAAADGTSPQFAAGHVLVMPSGEKQVWEPRGLISECVRNSDANRQSWLDFLNSNGRARQAWCMQKGYAHVRSTPALAELVEELDSSLDAPCG